ncbi:Calcium-dependent protein kinase, putative [Perkinsus marinus ATCC 50983]|uniref:Calcium-dependent protein kinase 1 n=1 Tax=Perkinsus marinus (strain ATCC 50983 / TXsc) TaxID=423536 RepID=C5L0T2_PERM5|nr:Calcium-dependent protein kinase, putative [Perkinsus marinus ATCC 50983]EER09574.1 Calcium-dependent protein kinase, putative [Perkinsus marinus ATCC 50983]|eukprot:XP_002777779.1 Calcium-dependent protein kinase, putative [Perkinsus marinus ATCC 50983]
MGICGSKNPSNKSPGSKEGLTSSGSALQKGVAEGGFGRANFILDNNGSLLEHYDVDTKKIGQGSYGSVTKAVNKSTHAVRAVKTISKSHVKNIERFKQEIAIMKMLDHPNIIKLFETFEDHRNIYLVMELCTGGELFDRIIDEGRFTEVQAAIVMQQILRAVYYMHENHIAHRDLKPENFLFLNKDPIEKSWVKLIDFGLSTYFDGTDLMKTKAGTPYYVAPQVLAGRYDEECDLWSCGVIMYILLCGYPPFYGETDADVLTKVRLGNYTFNASDWRNISADAKDLIRKLLKMNPRERYTAEQALNHPWVRNHAPGAEDVPLEGAQMNNLKSFRSLNKLKKAALNIIAQQMPDEEIAQLKKVFTSMDKNGDGQLTVQEMLEGIQKSGLKDVPEDLMDIMKQVDSDGSGVIDYTEFLAATLDKKKYIQEDRLWGAFRVFDRDGDGKITRQELAEVLNNGDVGDIVDGHIDEILKQADANGDGEIDFDEFVAMMEKQ